MQQKSGLVNYNFSLPIPVGQVQKSRTDLDEIGKTTCQRNGLIWYSIRTYY